MKNIFNKFKKYFSGKKDKNDEQLNDKDIRIIIQPWGFVLLAEYYRKGPLVILKNSYMIANWGTKEALGELALKGPTKNTVLYKEGENEMHHIMIIRTIKCNNKVWKEYF